MNDAQSAYESKQNQSLNSTESSRTVAVTVNNGCKRHMCEIFSKLTVKTPERQTPFMFI